MSTVIVTPVAYVKYYCCISVVWHVIEGRVVSVACSTEVMWTMWHYGNKGHPTQGSRERWVHAQWSYERCANIAL